MHSDVNLQVGKVVTPLILNLIFAVYSIVAVAVICNIGMAILASLVLRFCRCDSKRENVDVHVSRIRPFSIVGECREM